MSPKDELDRLNRGMLDVTQKQYKALKNSQGKNAAKRNVAFFAVGSHLLDPGAKIPNDVKRIVEAELQLIRDQIRPLFHR